MINNSFTKIAVSLALAGIVVGCESKAGTGAIVGGLGGAAVGGVIGSYSHARAGEGAAIGAAAGAIGGALVGHAMDKADEKKAKEQTSRSSSNDSYSYNSGSSYIAKRDVIDWSNRGVKDEVIVDRIERSGQTFRLTGADENELRDAGVSESVIKAMKNTARK